MENEQLQVMHSIYVGISVYNKLKPCRIKLRYKYLSLEEKKDLSLYLGILYTKNKISKKLSNKQLNVDVKYNYLKLKDYLNLYINEFAHNVDESNYESINDYFYDLTKKDVIKLFNEINSIDVDELIKDSNKQLVKK